MGAEDAWLGASEMGADLYRHPAANAVKHRDHGDVLTTIEAKW